MKIGILAAMEVELNFLLSALPIEKVHTHKGMALQYSRCNQHELVLGACGVGKVNAAAFTQLLIDGEAPDMIFNVGIAGGLSGVQPLDLVLGTSYSHHDVHPKQMASLFPFQQSFDVRAELIDQILSRSALPLLRGKITSGEGFIKDTQERERILNTFCSNAVDMESSAIAHCCFINQVDFAAIRCISDLANEEADDAYQSNERRAADKAGEALLSILQRW